MEKILVLMDPMKQDTNALDFSCYLGGLTPSRITCIFPDNPESNAPVQRDLHGFPVVFAGPDQKKHQIAAEARTEERISALKVKYAPMDISFKAHRNNTLQEEEIILESRFADLIIVDAGMTLDRQAEASPTNFVTDILKKSACPVFVAPEEFKELDEIIFCNNNTPDSIFAIKQFTHLFPLLQHKKLIVLQVMENSEKAIGNSEKVMKKNKRAMENSESKTSGENRLTEWLKCHYDDFRFEIFNGDPDHTLFDFLFKRQNIFIVMGAYGRNALSTFLKKSTAGPLIKMITQPIFISHS